MNQLDSYIPLSALNDFLFCPRRAGLKFIEGLRGENEPTVIAAHRLIRDIPSAAGSTLSSASISFPRMKTVTLSATFDGQHIQLEEPYPLLARARLLVTVLPDNPDPERDAMLRLSAQGLARAYGDDEPDYTNARLKEANPLYEGR